MIGKSLLRQPGEPLVCYCPPGVCQAPRGFRGPCRRASDVQAEGEAEYASWFPINPHGVPASAAIFRRGVSELSAAIEMLRDTGRFVDEEGEATAALADLLRELTDGVLGTLNDQQEKP